MASQRLAIQRMEKDDLEEVVLIATAPYLDPWSGKMFAEEIQNHFSHCFTAKDRGRPNGRVRGYICFRNMGEESELLNLSVHPEFRQLGIARKLMEFYIDFCRQREIRTFYLEVNDLNQPAIHLYQTFSYQLIGKRKKFYQGKFDALLMVKRF
jgi:ribosomal-protein-alanine N-acetyltransferase